MKLEEQMKSLWVTRSFEELTDSDAPDGWLWKPLALYDFEVLPVELSTFSLRKYEAVLVTSKHTIRALKNMSFDIKALLAGKQVWAVGRGTADSIISCGGHVDLVGEQGVRALLKSTPLVPHQHVLYPHGLHVSHTAAQLSKLYGAYFDGMPVYVFRERESEVLASVFRPLLNDSKAQYIWVTSPRRARRLVDMIVDSKARESLIVLAHGEQTARVLEKYDWKALHRLSPSYDALLQFLKKSI